MVTGQNHTLVQGDFASVTGVFHFSVTRDTACFDSGRVNSTVDQTEFQGGSCPEDFFRPCGVLNTR